MSTWLAGYGDTHSGSTVAVYPHEGFTLDDGGRYEPSPLQHLLADWWDEAWVKARQMIGTDPWHLIGNGDHVDGDHHNTPQIISRLPSAQIKGCVRLLRSGPLKGSPKAVHIIRGTESHVGKSGSAEEAIAAVLAAGDDDFPGVPVIPDPDTGTKSTFWRRFEVEGNLIDCRHHGRMGQRAHTRASYASLYAHDIWEEHVLGGDKCPRICLRSHHHTYMDSGPHPAYPRVITLPCWQMPTAFTHRIAIEALPSIGIVLIRIDGEQIDVHPILFKAERPTAVVC